jgi:uncharacterized protein (DUF1810 family)
MNILLTFYCIHAALGILHFLILTIQKPSLYFRPVVYLAFLIFALTGPLLLIIHIYEYRKSKMRFRKLSFWHYVLLFEKKSTQLKKIHPDSNSQALQKDEKSTHIANPITEDKSEEDTYNLKRFESKNRVYFDQAYTEIKNGRKETHWIWYICPQLTGLGRSHEATFYGIKSIEEAKAYLKHPYLSKKLNHFMNLLVSNEFESLYEVFGPDEKKVRSCISLFAIASDTYSIFHEALERYYHGKMCPRTLKILHCFGEELLKPRHPPANSDASRFSLE